MEDQNPVLGMDIFRESGEQIRNLTNVRSSFRVAMFIGMAAAVGFGADVGKDSVVAIGSLVALMALSGVLLTKTTSNYIHDALNRQFEACIVSGMTKPQLKILNITKHEGDGKRDDGLDRFDYSVYWAIWLISTFVWVLVVLLVVFDVQ